MDGLRIGIQLPEVEREVRWPEYAAMARAAEEVGARSIVLGGGVAANAALRSAGVSGSRTTWIRRNHGSSSTTTTGRDGFAMAGNRREG